MVFFDGLSRALGNRQHGGKKASQAKAATYQRSPALVDRRPPNPKKTNINKK